MPPTQTRHSCRRRWRRLAPRLRWQGVSHAATCSSCAPRCAPAAADGDDDAEGQLVARLLRLSTSPSLAYALRECAPSLLVFLWRSLGTVSGGSDCLSAILPPAVPRARRRERAA
eukprot:364175-Chlamydomonas_euryale.AAC.6